MGPRPRSNHQPVAIKRPLPLSLPALGRPRNATSTGVLRRLLLLCLVLLGYYQLLLVHKLHRDSHGGDNQDHVTAMAPAKERIQLWKTRIRAKLLLHNSSGETMAQGDNDDIMTSMDLSSIAAHEDLTRRDETILQQVAQNVRDYEPCRGKDALLEILYAANVLPYMEPNSNPSARAADVDNTTTTTTTSRQLLLELCQNLPTWDEVVNLYGARPIVYGMDTCPHYRDQILARAGNNSTTPMVRVAGLFNTGTNAMAITLDRNLHLEDVAVKPEDDLRVPWGKHVPVHHRFDHPAVVQHSPPVNNNNNLEWILPVVLIRDPYRWMKSMVGTFAFVGVL